MKLSQAPLLALAACVPAISARYIERNEANNVLDAGDRQFLIETAPGKTQWVTEDEKWELRRNGQSFMDLTDAPEFSTRNAVRVADVSFPDKCVQQKDVVPLVNKLSKDEMRKNLEKLTSFHNRYYKSDIGLKSSQWVLEKVNQIISEAGAKDHVSAKSFSHSWKQNSVVVTIPGQTESTIVIGAHQDSINLWLPGILASPGADDDGSGTVTIMEVFRTLLQNKDIIEGKAHNTIEFHWYSAEEAGLLGSQDIFNAYKKQGRDVKAMLQQDMTGYVQGTLDAGEPESVGVIVDYVHQDMTRFIKLVVEEYCNIPWVETKCGYACSDHASATKAGYPATFVIESAFEYSNPHIHGTDDLIKYLSFDHMLEHARMTLGLVYELGFHTFEEGSVSEEL